MEGRTIKTTLISLPGHELHASATHNRGCFCVVPPPSITHLIPTKESIHTPELEADIILLASYAEWMKDKPIPITFDSYSHWKL